ncbi:hypothetical protein MLD38_001982 [Melastoma candidum]|uniref:Uncharacterized protein n=1 Tax=Melastoma candidum TaxID=119954 RepID=A0ACB9SGK2_9MYRT|nr:hypothetical protein MLD38_001982 [Melastoma candidum]
MISFQAALSPDQRSKMTIPDTPRKRKWGAGVEEEGEERSRQKRHGSGKPGSSALDMELRLEETWDIQSREVRFYDSRTYDERTCKECEVTVTSHPPTTATPTVRRAVSLNLELNLQPYDEYPPPQEAEEVAAPSVGQSLPVFDEDPLGSLNKGEQRTDGQEVGGGGDEEMVATVCGRCHMLVMLCVSRPCCPNCKFLHPKPDQTPFTLLLRPPLPKCTAAGQLLC